MIKTKKGKKRYGECDRIIDDRIISTGIRFSIFNGFDVNDFVVLEPLYFCMFYKNLFMGCGASRSRVGPDSDLSRAGRDRDHSE
ncbi:MAG: hypothetical protein HY343_07660, partial [Lentisphaerae bacterium]|nr:hypothetical protein [Lentisphaerota bacterium]